MHHVQQIASLDLPGLEPYRTLRRAVEHAQKGIFVAEGDKVVRLVVTCACGERIEVECIYPAGS